jgi:hypothetical protein
MDSGGFMTDSTQIRGESLERQTLTGRTLGSLSQSTLGRTANSLQHLPCSWPAAPVACRMNSDVRDIARVPQVSVQFNNNNN